MTLAEKVLRTKTDFDAVYNAGVEAGKTDSTTVSPANYSSSYAFKNDDWAESDNVVLDLPNLDDINYNFFYGVMCKKIKTLTVKSQTPVKRAIGAFQGKVNAENENLEKLILYIDFSQCTSFANFATTRAKLRYIEGTPIDFSSAAGIGDLFNYCTKLESFRVAPETIKVNISFSRNNLLDEETIQSVIDGMSDLTDSTACTLSLHADVIAKLTDEQLTQVAQKNWNVA